MADIVDARRADPAVSSARAESLAVTIRATHDLVTVSVRGELDIATAPILVDAFDAARLEDPSLVVVDVGGLRFVDAHGLSVLIAARRSLRSRSADLVVRDPSAMLQKMLAITGLASLAETV